jgi:hypothetical protein
LPEGYGYLQAKVDSKGTVRWTGKLADGSGVSFTGLLGPEGALESWLVLYRGSGCFRASAVIGPDSSVEGSGNWWKGADPRGRGNFAAGFGYPMDAANILLEGGLWTPPARGDLVLPTFIGAANSWIVFGGGGVEASATDPTTMFELTTAHRAVFDKAGSLGNPASVKVTVSSKTGLFRGSMSLLDLSATGRSLRRRASFTGVLPGAGMSGGRGFLLLPQLEGDKVGRTLLSTAVELVPMTLNDD